MIVRVNVDTDTLDSGNYTADAAVHFCEQLAKVGVWDYKTRLWYPPSRIVSAQIMGGDPDGNDGHDVGSGRQ